MKCWSLREISTTFGSESDFLLLFAVSHCPKSTSGATLGLPVWQIGTPYVFNDLVGTLHHYHAPRRVGWLPGRNEVETIWIGQVLVLGPSRWPIPALMLLRRSIKVTFLAHVLESFSFVQVFRTCPRRVVAYVRVAYLLLWHSFQVLLAKLMASGWCRL